LTSVPDHLPKHEVARLEIEGNELAALIAASRSHRNDLPLLGLLLDGIGDDDAALGLVVALKAADDDAIVQRMKFHEARFRSARKSRFEANAKRHGAFDLLPIWPLLALVTREC
jgi:hypothetical protein